MFDVPSLGMLASRCILQESRANELLEEIDENDITSTVSSLSESWSPYRLTIFFLTTSFLTFLFYEYLFYCTKSSFFSNFLLYEFILSVSVVLLFGVFLWFIVKWRLKVLVQTLKNLESSAHKANRAVLEREMLSFGLSLPSLRLHSTCRLRLFLYCRENVHLLSELSESLVCENFMMEEKGRLLKVFYTDEMRKLVHANVGLDSSHLTQRGIGTLLDMFILHRSEVLRLIVLYLLRSPSLMAFTLMFRLVFLLHAELIRRIICFDVLANTLSLKRRNRAKIPWNRSEIDASNGLNAVVFMLDDIINGILDKTLTAVEVKRALNRVLLISSLSGSHLNPPTEKFDGTTEERKVFDERHEHTTLLGDRSGAARPDEVFEVIASPDEADDDSQSLGVCDDSRLQRNHELIEELRVALADRAVEFAERERRALAAFHGVADITSHLSQRSVRPDEALQLKEIQSDERSELQGVSEGVSCASQNRPLRQMPADLLAALRMRSVVEETIGDQ